MELVDWEGDHERTYDDASRVCFHDLYSDGAHSSTSSGPESVRVVKSQGSSSLTLLSSLPVKWNHKWRRMREES